MSRRNRRMLSEFAYSFILISCIIGIGDALAIFKLVLANFNLILVELFDESILSVLFKYCITFPIVGKILVKIGSPKGKEGHYIGKTLYFIIGYVIGMILDFASKLIFN